MACTRCGAQTNPGTHLCGVCAAGADTVISEPTIVMSEAGGHTPQWGPPTGAAAPNTTPQGFGGQESPHPVPPTAPVSDVPPSPLPPFTPGDHDQPGGSRTALLAVLAVLGVLAVGAGAFLVTTVLVGQDQPGSAGGTTQTSATDDEATTTTGEATTTSTDDEVSATSASTSSSSSSTTDPVVEVFVPGNQIAPSASSSLAGSGSLTYGPDNLLDGDTDTAWNDDTGAAVDGAGQWLRFDLAQPTDLLAVEIVNGYAKSDEVFTRNEAARAIQLTTDTGVVVDAVLDRTTTVQRVEINAPGASTVTLTVIDVYPGQAYQGSAAYTDLALTDVWFVAAG